MKAQLAAAFRGKAFLFQEGDCAESFNQFRANGIHDTFKVLLQMAIIFTYGTKVPEVSLVGSQVSSQGLDLSKPKLKMAWY